MVLVLGYFNNVYMELALLKAVFFLKKEYHLERYRNKHTLLLCLRSTITSLFSHLLPGLNLPISSNYHQSVYSLIFILPFPVFLTPSYSIVPTG